MGILLLNAYGRLVPRRRVIEGGLIALGVLLAVMALSGRISSFLAASTTRSGLPDLSLLTSLLSIVVGVAFFAGIAYAAVAIPSQTQLQEDLPEDVRGRVFGVLNMLVSVASFLPILIVGPIADLLGTTIVLLLVAGLIVASGVASIALRGPLRVTERDSRAAVGTSRDPFVEALRAELDEHRPDRVLGLADAAERGRRSGPAARRRCRRQGRAERRGNEVQPRDDDDEDGCAGNLHDQRPHEREAERERRVQGEREDAVRGQELATWDDDRDHRGLGRGEEDRDRRDRDVQQVDQREVRADEEHRDECETAQDVREDEDEPPIQAIHENPGQG